MKIAWLLSILSLCYPTYSAEKNLCSGPVWTVNLSATYKFRPFGIPKHARTQAPSRWTTQQGVAFISPATMAIYQVEENSGLTSLERRDPSGGSGKYVLHAVFLEAASARFAHTLRLTTSSDGQAGIYPTHDGEFLVVTGRLLRLYSPTFSEIKSVTLPTPLVGNWLVSVIRPGRRIYVATVHLSQRYLLNADTLESIDAPGPGDVAWWPKGNALFPGSTAAGVGFFDSAGKWIAMDLNSNSNRRVLGVILGAPSEGAGAGWGQPVDLRIFSPTGEIQGDIGTHDELGSFVSNGDTLAAAFYHHRADLLDLGLPDKPLRVTAYDLHRRSEKCSLRIAGPPFYDLSSIGTIALIQQDQLYLYSAQ